jgi:rRNA processing protein Gar1
MRLLGVVECRTPSGRILVKGTFAPEERERVYDRRGSEVGYVSEIFGNVNGPFISVSANRLIRKDNVGGLELYIKERETDGKSKGDKRRHGRS